MSAVAEFSQADTLLAGDVLAHLDAQLIAVRRLLAIVLEQGAAIRRRDVHDVVRMAGILEAELHRRALLDAERMRLLERAGVRLGVSAGAITLSQLERLMDPAAAHDARERSAELRGMLMEVEREHRVNRALMNQELAFLDHLLSLAEGGSMGYGAAGARTPRLSLMASNRQRVLDLEV